MLISRTLPSIRTSLIALVIGAALFTGNAACAEARRVPFDIPAESTAAALNDLARQANIHLLFPYDVAMRTNAVAIRGDYTVAQALDLILTNSGLEVVSLTDETVTLRAATSSAAVEPVTEVIVTGSHLRGGAPTSPVHTLTRQDIDASGYSQIGDLMRSLPENFAGGQNPGVLGAQGTNIANLNSTNASTMNLRGLGSDATLVLVNGHRLAPDSSFQGVDISGVPLSAVKRIEVVPDGASALYGSDAVAGVTNIILRKTFNGVETSARVGTTTEGGGAEQTYSVLAGRAAGSGYILFNLEYSKQDAIYAGDRAFASAVAPDATLMQPQTRRSAFLSAGRDLNSTVSVSVDALLSDRDTTYVNHAYAAYPGYTGWAYTPSYSVTGMADLALPREWKAHLTIGASGSRNSSGITSYGADYPSYFTNSLQYAEITTDGTLLELPSGPVKVAVGAGVRQEDFQQDFAGSPTLLTPSRQVDYLYLEGQVPLVAASDMRAGLHALDLNLSARTEDYSDFGTTTNPRIGVRYQPFNDLTIRASWGKSFKAPSFFQMYQQFNLTLFQPGIMGGANDGTTALLVSGGNPNLKPERSTSSSFGAEYSPKAVRGLTLSVNLFDIDYTDRVVQPINPATVALSNSDFVPFVARNPSAQTVEALVARAFHMDNYSGLPYASNNVSAIAYNNYQNATAQTVHGVDLGYRQSFTVKDGTLSTFVNATWLRLEQQTIETRPSAHLSGTVFNAPDFKARGGMTWQTGGFSASGIVNYLGDETDNGITPNEEIGSWTTVDATLSYNFDDSGAALRGVKVALSASNLFDRDPPRAGSPAIAYGGLAYDSTNTSLVGRFVSLTVTKGW